MFQERGPGRRRVLVKRLDAIVLGSDSRITHRPNLTCVLFLLVLCPLSSRAASDASFDAPFTGFEVSFFPSAIATGDLNGDGHADLVTTHEASNVLSVLLGHGDGKFSSGPSAPMNGPQWQVALIDLDHDGRLDAVVNENTAIAVALGNGDGTFAARVDYPTATNFGDITHTMQIGDVTSDGNADVIALEYGGSLSLFPGHGDGTLGARVTIVTGVYHFALADMDGDGRLDLVNAVGGQLSIRLGNGDGTFGAPSSYPVGAPTTRLAVADFNHDARPDVAVSSSNGAETPAHVAILLGTGGGAVGAAELFPVQANPQQIMIADLDADGSPDVVTANIPQSYGGTLSVLRGRGDGRFDSSRDFPAGVFMRKPVAADFDEDGRLDLAAPCRVASSVLIYHGNGDATFGGGRSSPAGFKPASPAVADLDRDGLLDVIATRDLGDSIEVALADGPGIFHAGYAIAGGGAAYLEVGDLNGDGRLDLVNTSGLDGDSTVALRLGNGDGTFQPATHWNVGPWPDHIEIVDLDEDGRLDLIVSNSGGFAATDTGHTVSVLLGNGDGTFEPRSAFETGDRRPAEMEVADFDRDGHEDLAVLNHGSTPRLSILFGDGHGALAPRPAFPMQDAASFGVGDLTEDGIPDLVLEGADIVVLVGVGDGSFTPLPPVPEGNYAAIAGIEDVNRDGHLDLLMINYYENALRVLRGAGDGTLARQPFDFGLGASASYPVFADFDGDGRLDAMTANHFLNDFMVVFNTTPGPLSVPRDPVAEAPARFRIVANPSHGSPIVEYTSRVGSPARFELYDVAGRRIAVREIPARAAGVHRIRLSESSRMRAGIYFVRFASAGASGVARAVVLE
jgi:hypothetical protein